METFETISADIHGPVATITLNRPGARNAMSHQMVAELLRAFSGLRDDPAYGSVRVVVLRAAGPTFCAGGDVRDLMSGAESEEERAAVGRLDELLRAVNEAPQVVIARVQGHALGGGLGLVCVSDIVVAGYSASFGLPEVRLGLVPAVIAPYVVQRLGPTCARRLMLTGGQLTPKRARRIGLAQEVCADLELDARVEAIVGEVLLCAPGALRECKRLLFTVLREPEAATLEYRVDSAQSLARRRGGAAGHRGVSLQATSALGATSMTTRQRRTEASPALPLASSSAPRMIRKVLVANRGEIACRILRTCRAMGIETVAVFSEADAGARHVEEADEAVRLGPSAASASYLNIPALIEAAHRTGADAIHPGYGFLSEQTPFALACREAGITFVGPRPEVIARMGSKCEARRLMASAGVPIVPGYDEADQSDERLLAAAQEIGFPVLVKASAGGGGKGMRAVERAEDSSCRARVRPPRSAERVWRRHAAAGEARARPAARRVPDLR